MNSPGPDPVPCRLCDGATEPAFRLTLLHKHDVQYWRCRNCHSLQSDSPTWLQEAYEDAIAGNDTGAVNRNLVMHAAILTSAKIMGVKGPVLDFGGGAGMLCRLLRDSGFDARLYDRYADPVYARAFALSHEEARAKSWQMLSAVEVFEHCPAPGRDLDEIFDFKPSVLFATTILYDGQGPDWWYLSPSTGQHVFFYSSEAMRLLADRKGYHYYGFGVFHIFTARRIGAVRRFLLRLALSRAGLRVARLLVAATQSGHHAEADNRALSAPPASR